MALTNLKFKYSMDDVTSFALNSGLDSFFLKVAILKYDFFNKFSFEGMTFENISDNFEIGKRELSAILPLFITMGFLDYKKDKYFLTKFSKEHLLESSPKDMSNFINLRSKFYPDSITFDMVLSVLKTGNPFSYMKGEGKWSESIANNKEMARIFTSGMNSRGVFLASKLVNKIGISSSKSLLDIGGSSGIYSCFLKEKFKNLKVDVLELPTVAENTRISLKSKGFDSKVGVIEGDMFTFNSEEKYDVHMYSNVLHDWSYHNVKKLIAHSYENLPLNGKIVIHDGHLNLGKNAKSLMHNNLTLIIFTEGRYYYYHEIRRLLTETGFKKIKIKKTVGGRSLIVAIK